MSTPTALRGAAPRANRAVAFLVALLVSLTGVVALAQPASAAGATITGRFVTEDGKPIDAIGVYLDAGGPPVAETISGGDGRFQFSSVSAGSYSLSGSDYFSTYVVDGMQLTNVIDGETRNVGDIVLEPWDFAIPANVRLTGHVYDQSGKPARGVQVLARTTTALQADSVVGGFAVTDRNGLFQMESDGGGGLPVPGTYKLYYTDRLALPTQTFVWGPRYSGDKQTWATATTVTIEAAGKHAAPDVTVTSSGGVSGALTGSVPMTAGTVTVYNSDGEQVATKATGAGGTYSISTLRPGSYYLRFSSTDVGGTKFVRTYWPGAPSIAEATPVVVKAAQFTSGLNQVLSDQLTAFRKPTVSGRPVVGSTLTAAPGSWSLTAGTEYTYEWLRSGATVGTAKTYRPVAADAGKVLSVRVTARLGDKSGIATSSPTTAVKWVSTVSAKAAYKRPKKQLVLTVRVAVPGLANPGGTVTVKEGSRTVKARVAVRNGTAVVTILKPKAGRHTYALVYSGTTTVLASTGRVSIKIPKR